MGYVVDFLGTVTVILLVFYVSVFLLSKAVSLKTDLPHHFNMPALEPVPIPTKSHPYAIEKLVLFVFEVRKWKLAENWYFTLPDGDTIILPRGFVFDGASIPKIFWALLSPTGLLLLPGLVHDYGYKYDQLWQLDSNGKPIPYQKGAGKVYWDDLFRRVSNEVNEMFVINVIAWCGVLLGGSGAWDRHRTVNGVPVRPDIG